MEFVTTVAPLKNAHFRPNSREQHQVRMIETEPLEIRLFFCADHVDVDSFHPEPVLQQKPRHTQRPCMGDIIQIDRRISHQSLRFSQRPFTFSPEICGIRAGNADSAGEYFQFPVDLLIRENRRQIKPLPAEAA